MDYTKLQIENIADYFDYRRFRTVLEEDRQQPHGLSEIAVVFDLKKLSKSTKKIVVPSAFEDNRFIYGFAIIGEKLSEQIKQYGEISEEFTLMINRFDNDKFIVFFQNPDGEYLPHCYFSAVDVETLLRKCRNPSL